MARGKILSHRCREQRSKNTLILIRNGISNNELSVPLGYYINTTPPVMNLVHDLQAAYITRNVALLKDKQ